MEKKTLIYLYGFSALKNARLIDLINILMVQIKKGMSINVVLIHDAVIGISKKGKIPQNLIELISLPLTVYAMIPDIKARGIDLNTIHEKVQLIGYEDLVELLVETPKIISWM